MKKFVPFAMLLSLALVTIGCKPKEPAAPSTPPSSTEPSTPSSEPAAPADAPAEAPK